MSENKIINKLVLVIEEILYIISLHYFYIYLFIIYIISNIFLFIIYIISDILLEFHILKYTYIYIQYINTSNKDKYLIKLGMVHFWVMRSLIHSKRRRNKHLLFQLVFSEQASRYEYTIQYSAIRNTRQ